MFSNISVPIINYLLQVVVTTTSKDVDEAEIVTVTAVSGDGMTLTIDPALEFQHLGKCKMKVLSLL